MGHLFEGCDWPTTLNLYNAELLLFKPWRLKGFFQFNIVINVLVSSFLLVWIPVLWVSEHYEDFNYLSAGIIAYTSFWRIKTVPVLKGLPR